MAPLLTALVALLISIQVVLAGRVSGKLNVHLVCHTHDDAGWLKVIYLESFKYNKQYAVLLASGSNVLAVTLTAASSQVSSQVDK